MPHKRKNAKAARSAPEGFSLAFLQQCGMGNKARSEEISFGGRKKILKFLSDLIGATPASWLNMVEIWFGILTRQSLRGASFSSTQALSEHIAAFVEAYNQDAQPFVWRKREVKGCQLRNNARNFCN